MLLFLLSFVQTNFTHNLLKLEMSFTHINKKGLILVIITSLIVDCPYAIMRGLCWNKHLVAEVQSPP